MTQSTKPLVTICIPSYNHQDYIADCINSVIGQDYENIELIIIDDGSTDNTKEAVKALVPKCQARFKRFEFIARANKGLTSTLNEAIDWAEGKYFSAIASDDSLISTKTSTLVKVLENDKKIAAAFGQINYIDEHSIVQPEKNLRSKEVIHTFEDLIRHINIPRAPTALIRTALIRAVGKYDSSIAIEDWYMWLKLTESGEYTLFSTTDILANYRRHTQNMSSKSRLMHNARVAIVDRFKHAPSYTEARSTILSLGALSIANDECLYPIQLAMKAKFAPRALRTRAIIKALIPRPILKAYFSAKT
jgi:alpha-1,3-rhamnosyltransferase